MHGHNLPEHKESVSLARTGVVNLYYIQSESRQLL